MTNKKKQNVISFEAESELSTPTAEEIIADLEAQIKAATEAADKKKKSALEHALNQCDIVSKKYMTISGYMQVLETYRAIFDERPTDDVIGEIAIEMSNKAAQAKELIENASIEQYDDLFDDLIETDFVKKVHSAISTVIEYMSARLYSEIHGNLIDIVEFSNHTESDINKLKESLAEIKNSSN